MDNTEPVITGISYTIPPSEWPNDFIGPVLGDPMVELD